jgi:hypothetical protein
LNIELAKKGKIIEDLKNNVLKFSSQKKDIKNDEDVVEYLVGIVKDKERMIED